IQALLLQQWTLNRIVDCYRLGPLYRLFRVSQSCCMLECSFVHGEWCASRVMAVEMRVREGLMHTNWQRAFSQEPALQGGESFGELLAASLQLLILGTLALDDFSRGFGDKALVGKQGVAAL